jgi:hypothetical protein
MTYTPISNPGEKFYISATPTGSPTLEILGVDPVPAYGPETKEIELTTMRDVVKVFGAAALDDNGSLQIKGKRSNQDAGQQMLVAAQAAKKAYNFKHVFNDAGQLLLTNNTTVVFSAMVLSFKTDGSQAGGVKTFTATLRITGAIAETLPS